MKNKLISLWLIIRESSGSKTVPLSFGNDDRIEDITIYKKHPIMKINYQIRGGSKHNFDNIIADQFVIYGAEVWEDIQKFYSPYPIHDPKVKSDNDIFYTEDMKPDSAQISCKGYKILGGISSDSQKGLGMLLPVNKVKWLRLLRTGKKYASYERWMLDDYESYIYPVTQGAEQLINQGKEYVDLITSGKIK